MRAHDRAVVLTTLALAAGFGCGGHREPAADATAPAAAVSGSSRVSVRDEGPALPLCTLGKGDPDAACDEHGTPQFLAAVDAAVDELVQKRPELFDLDRVVGQNGYFVRDQDAVYQGVAANLQARGLCANGDFEQLEVKDAQTHSERYDLVLANGHLRRGAGSFRATCAPAAFPLDPTDVIKRVRVGFYSITCDDGRTPPRNGEDVLPVECTGYVTATPKDKNDDDVDKRVHGPEIAWTLEQDGEPVRVDDFPGVAFNKVLRGLDPGAFHLCATVQGHRGCLDGTVVAP